MQSTDLIGKRVFFEWTPKSENAGVGGMFAGKIDLESYTAAGIIVGTKFETGHIISSGGLFTPPTRRLVISVIGGKPDAFVTRDLDDVVFLDPSKYPKEATSDDAKSK